MDAIADHTGAVVIGGIMEHIEQAGIHSGDSACAIPTLSLSDAVLETIRTWTMQLAQRLQVVGLMNLQLAGPRRANLHFRSQSASLAHSSLCV